MEQAPRHPWILNDLPTAEKGTDCMRQYYLGLAAAFLRARHEMNLKGAKLQRGQRRFHLLVGCACLPIEAKGLSDVTTASRPVLRGRSANWAFARTPT